MDVRHCPRCELRFASRSELVDHLVCEHGFAEEPLEKFQYRWSAPPAVEGDQSGRRCLVVVSQTIGHPEVISAVRDRIRDGVTRFVVLVPATALWGPSNALVGHGGGEGFRSNTVVDQAAFGRAEARVRGLVDALLREGCEAHGEVGPADPELAVSRLLRKQRVDEILVARPPVGASHWLDVDVPRRLQRRFGLPVTTIETSLRRPRTRGHGDPLWWRGRKHPETAMTSVGFQQEDVTMDGHIGDRIVVRSRRVGEPNSVGEITRVLGGSRFLVRWADGRESTVVPGTDATIENDEADSESPRDLALTVDLRIHIDGDRCRADAVMHMASGVLRGSGEARRHPRDPEVPLVGEELAVARALADLGSVLEHAASDCIASHESPTLHLVP